MAAATDDAPDRIWPELIWYVAYGSNLLRERFLHYLAPAATPRSDAYGHHLGCVDDTPPLDDRPVVIDHGLYFAGHSVRWDGPVAFVRLEPRGEVPCRGRAYLISGSQLLDLIRQENRAPAYDWDASHLATEAHEHRVLAVGRGNYNALLRLEDIDALPAVTLTTARDLAAASPPDRYLDVLRLGLAERGMSDIEATAYLSRVAQASA